MDLLAADRPSRSKPNVRDSIIPHVRVSPNHADATVASRGHIAAVCSTIFWLASCHQP